MEEKNKRLFTLQLRIHSQNVSLPVLHTDSLNDLFLRLLAKTQLDHKYSHQLRQKLEHGLQGMAGSFKGSEKVKSKLQELVEDNKIVILGVMETEKEEHPLNETPFNILLDTTANPRKHSAEHTKRNYLQENHGSPALKRNYNMQISQVIYEETENSKPYPSYHPQNTFTSTAFILSSNKPQQESNFKRRRQSEEASWSPAVEEVSKRSRPLEYADNTVRFRTLGNHNYQRDLINSSLDCLPEGLSKFQHRKPGIAHNQPQNTPDRSWKCMASQADAAVQPSKGLQGRQTQQFTNSSQAPLSEAKTAKPLKKFSYLDECEA